MHETALGLMKEALEGVVGAGLVALDVGSLDVNGTYRPLVEGRGWRYVGLDLGLGLNVDVAVEPFQYPFADGTFDVVLSGSTMEHVTAIWRWLPELTRVLRPGGVLVIITHTAWEEHRHPVDCWRVMPDGMAYLFDLTGVLGDYVIEMVNKTDIVGWAVKRTRMGATDESG